MKRAGLRAQVDYRRRPRHRSGQVSVVAPNRLQQKFTTQAPDEAWVTDITHIRTHEGWLYLAIVLDLFSRGVIGWSMQPRITRDIVLDVLLMAVWRRKPMSTVTVHSYQGSQYTSNAYTHLDNLLPAGQQAIGKYPECRGYLQSDCPPCNTDSSQH
jgi:putative transposase